MLAGIFIGLDALCFHCWMWMLHSISVHLLWILSSFAMHTRTRANVHGDCASVPMLSPAIAFEVPKTSCLFQGLPTGSRVSIVFAYSSSTLVIAILCQLYIFRRILFSHQNNSFHDYCARLFIFFPSQMIYASFRLFGDPPVNLYWRLAHQFVLVIHLLIQLAGLKTRTHETLQRRFALLLVSLPSSSPPLVLLSFDLLISTVSSTLRRNKFCCSCLCCIYDASRVSQMLKFTVFSIFHEEKIYGLFHTYTTFRSVSLFLSQFYFLKRNRSYAYAHRLSYIFFSAT